MKCRADINGIVILKGQRKELFEPYKFSNLYHIINLEKIYLDALVDIGNEF